MSIWPIREPWVPLLPGLGHLQIRVAPAGHWAELGCTASLLFPWQPSEWVCHSPLPRGHCRPWRRSGGHQVAEPRHCCDTPRSRLHLPPVKDRPVGAGTASVGCTGREQPDLALARAGAGAAAADFLVVLMGCCFPHPTHGTDDAGRRWYPKSAPGPAHQGPACFLRLPHSKLAPAPAADREAGPGYALDVTCDLPLGRARRRTG